MYRTKITAVSHYLPNNITTNKNLAELYDITEDKIFSKTGIKERRYLKGGCTSDLAIRAIKILIKDYKIDKESIDCLILGTSTPDYFFPSTAVSLLNKLKINKAFGFDIAAACSGFAYAIHIAKNLISTGSVKKVLICGGDKMTATLNNYDYKTSVLFGDGAGAILLERATDDDKNVINNSVCKVEADGLEKVYMKSGLNNKTHSIGSINMNGRLVYDNAVEHLMGLVKSFFKENGLTIDDFDFIIPHQANKKMMSEVFEKLNIPLDKVLFNIENYGNTGAGTIPIAISDFHNQNILKKGNRIMLIAFGAGYTSSIIDLNWDM